jgi:hypothetical protein
VHETALLGTTKSARDGCQRIACLQSTHGLLGALTSSVFLLGRLIGGHKVDATAQATTLLQ